MATRKKPGTKRKAARRKPAKRRVTKRAPAKAAKKRAAKRRPAKAAKKRAAKRAPAKAAKKRPAKRRPVKAAKKRPATVRRARKPAPPAFAKQKAGASVKDLLLFELERARVAVLASIQGIGSGTAMQPVAPGKWSIHEIVLHLAVRDRVRLEEFDALLGGRPASWAGIEDPAEHAAINEAHLAPMRERSWDEAVRLLMTTRAELLERLQAVPAEPAQVWSEAHPFGSIMGRLSTHDRKHAESIKKARVAG